MRTKYKLIVGICFFAITFMGSFLSLAETINYTYDSLNRIIREERSSGAVIVYAYDSAGNRTSKVISGSPVTTTIPTTTTTITVDTDHDGIPDSQDNCPNTPNGPLLGTCSSTSDKPSINCTSDADCAKGCSSNGLCIKDQRDADNDGVGDVCDNCPNKPNGPLLGTCMPISDKAGATCNSDTDCVVGCSTNGKCSLNQEDTNGDGVGDVCPIN